MSKIILYGIWVIASCNICALRSVVVQSTIVRCPITLTQHETNIIKKNYKNFLAALKKQTYIVGGDRAKPYDMRCTNLSNINLAARYFKYLDLREANLDESNLSNTKFESVNLANASLKNIKADRAQFWDSTLDNTDFSKADMASVTLLGTKKPLSAKKANFTQANLSSASQISNVDLSDAICDNANFEDTGLSYVKLSPKTSFKKANFTMAAINNTSGHPGSLREWLLGQQANLTNAFINGKYTDIPVN